MSLPGPLISHRQGPEGGRGGAADGDHGDLTAGSATHVSCEIGAELADTDHVYLSVHKANGALLVE